MIFEFKIEKGIPLPSKRHTTNKKYQLELMEIGDSFFQECINGETSKLALITICGIARRLKPKKFTCRSRYQEPIGVRCWRIE